MSSEVYVWKHFAAGSITGTTLKYGNCKYCNAQNIVPTMLQHLLHSCCVISEETKAKIRSDIGIDRESSISTNPTTSALSIPIATQTVKTPFNGLPDFRGQKYEEVDELLAKVFRAENIPPSFLTNSFFKEFAAKLNCTYRLPKPADPKFKKKALAEPTTQGPRKSLVTGNSSGSQGSATNAFRNSIAGRSTTSSKHSELQSINIPSASTSAQANDIATGGRQVPLQPARNILAKDGAAAPIFNTVEFQRCKVEMKGIVKRADFVMLSAKCFRLCAEDGRILGHVISLFVYTPKPILFAQFDEKSSDKPTSNFSQKLANFVDVVLEGIQREKIVALTTDRSQFCAEFRTLFAAKCPWVLMEFDYPSSKDHENNSPASHILAMLNPAKRPEFSGIALQTLSESFVKNPNFKQSKLIVEWAHWVARTGSFAPDSRAYAWAPDTLEMDAFTWWNGFFADSPLCKLFSVLNLIEQSAQCVAASWLHVEQLLAAEIQRINAWDLEGTSKTVYVRYNKSALAADTESIHSSFRSTQPISTQMADVDSAANPSKRIKIEDQN